MMMAWVGRYAQGAAELELQHQRKLTASAMQYKKLKDAFNDLVVAARDDSAEAKVTGLNVMQRC